MIIRRKRMIIQSRNLLPYLITACITLVIGLILYYVKGVEPFGHNSVLCMDLWGQYFPMYVQNAEAGSLSELLFSWNGAFGYNNWAQNAYYGNSIFLLFMRFIPLGRMITAVNVFCLIKIILSSVSCLAFLRYKLKKRSPILIAGAVSYGISAYMLAFLSQFMWTDCMIYAPLILIGLDRLITKKKPLMYTFMLSVAIISNFYIGFSICIFCCLYFIFSAILLLGKSRADDGRIHIYGKKDFIKSVVRFGIFSLLAGGISAAVILPVGLALQSTLAVEAEAPKVIEWYGDMSSVLQQMLPGKKLSLAFTGVNLATGIMMFMLVPVYFFNKNIRVLERYVNSIFLGILFLSVNCNILDYMWHGFHFPNQLPGRWTFLFILFMIFLACRGVTDPDGLTIPRMAGGVGIGIFLIYIACRGSDVTKAVKLSSVEIFTLISGAILLMFVAVAAWYRKSADTSGREKILHGMTYILLGILTYLHIFECANNFIRVAQFSESGLRVSDMYTYNASLNRVNGAGKELKKFLRNSDASDKFYRAELTPYFTFNSSMLGDYHGMGYYSSTMMGDTFRLLKYLGNRVYADKVSSVYNMYSPVQNSLFGINYYIDTSYNTGFSSPDEKILPGANLLTKYPGGAIYENPTALSVAYRVSDKLADLTVTDEVRSISNQNELLNSMCGKDMQVFKKLDYTEFTYENVTLYENEDWNRQYFYLKSGESKAEFYYTYTCDGDGPVYLEHNFRAGNIYVNSTKVNTGITPNMEKFKYIGDYEKGDVIYITVSVENISVGCHGVNMYRYDSEAWYDAYEMLSAGQMKITSFKNTEIKGDITLDGDGLVFVSLAQDGGWTVTCDGEKVDTVTIGGALMGLRLKSGNHRLVFRYCVPGFAAGSVISTISALLFIFAAVYGNRGLREKIFKTQTK